MLNLTHQSRFNGIFRTIITVVLTAFVTTSLVPPQKVYAQSLALPMPGTMVKLTNQFMPPMVKGIKVDPNNPLAFNFLIDPGQTPMSQDAKKIEYTKLIKYFLAALTTSEKDMWVNLSPYEHNRITSKEFGDTEMGRDMLAQDYILKQLTASLVYPEDGLGKKFWDRIYQRVRTEVGSAQVPVNTFNKVWIIPQSATIFEKGNVAMVTASHLKVLMEEDYLSLDKNANAEKMGLSGMNPKIKAVNKTSSQVVREVILPEIEREVNEGSNFMQLRQMYNSMILASWFKQRLKQHLLGKVYVNQNKNEGVELKDKQDNERIFKQYVQAFKKGVYNYIKEEQDPVSGQMIPRKYFSGGTAFGAQKQPVAELDLGQTPREGQIGVTSQAPAMTASAAQVADEVKVKLDAQGVATQFIAPLAGPTYTSPTGTTEGRTVAFDYKQNNKKVLDAMDALADQGEDVAAVLADPEQMKFVAQEALKAANGAKNTATKIPASEITTAIDVFKDWLVVRPIIQKILPASNNPNLKEYPDMNPEFKRATPYATARSYADRIAMDFVLAVRAGQIVKGNELYEIYHKMIAKAVSDGNQMQDYKGSTPDGDWKHAGDVLSEMLDAIQQSVPEPTVVSEPVAPAKVPVVASPEEEREATSLQKSIDATDEELVSAVEQLRKELGIVLALGEENRKRITALEAKIQELADRLTALEQEKKANPVASSLPDQPVQLTPQQREALIAEIATLKQKIEEEKNKAGADKIKIDEMEKIISAMEKQLGVPPALAPTPAPAPAAPVAPAAQPEAAKPVAETPAPEVKAPAAPVAGEPAKSAEAPAAPVVGEPVKSAEAPAAPVAGEPAKSAEAPAAPVVGEPVKSAEAPAAPVAPAAQPEAAKPVAETPAPEVKAPAAPAAKLAVRQDLAVEEIITKERRDQIIREIGKETPIAVESTFQGLKNAFKELVGFYNKNELTAQQKKGVERILRDVLTDEEAGHLLDDAGKALRTSLMEVARAIAKRNREILAAVRLLANPDIYTKPVGSEQIAAAAVLDSLTADEVNNLSRETREIIYTLPILDVDSSLGNLRGKLVWDIITAVYVGKDRPEIPVTPEALAAREFIKNLTDAEAEGMDNALGNDGRKLRAMLLGRPIPADRPALVDAPLALKAGTRPQAEVRQQIDPNAPVATSRTAPVAEAQPAVAPVQPAKARVPSENEIKNTLAERLLIAKAKVIKADAELARLKQELATNPGDKNIEARLEAAREIYITEQKSYTMLQLQWKEEWGRRPDVDISLGGTYRAPAAVEAPAAPAKEVASEVKTPVAPPAAPVVDKEPVLAEAPAAPAAPVAPVAEPVEAPRAEVPPAPEQVALGEAIMAFTEATEKVRNAELLYRDNKAQQRPEGEVRINLDALLKELRSLLVIVQGVVKAAQAHKPEENLASAKTGLADAVAKAEEFVAITQASIESAEASGKTVGFLKKSKADLQKEIDAAKQSLNPGSVPAPAAPAVPVSEKVPASSEAPAGVEIDVFVKALTDAVANLELAQGEFKAASAELANVNNQSPDFQKPYEESVTQAQEKVAQATEALKGMVDRLEAELEKNNKDGRVVSADYQKAKDALAAARKALTPEAPAAPVVATGNPVVAAAITDVKGKTGDLFNGVKAAIGIMQEGQTPTALVPIVDVLKPIMVSLGEEVTALQKVLDAVAAGEGKITEQTTKNLEAVIKSLGDALDSRNPLIAGVINNQELGGAGFKFRAATQGINEKVGEVRKAINAMKPVAVAEPKAPRAKGALAALGTILVMTSSFFNRGTDAWWGGGQKAAAGTSKQGKATPAPASGDKALVSPVEKKYGGIDFDDKYLEMNLKGDGINVPVPAGFEWLLQQPIRGFIPQILDIRSGAGFTLSFFKGLLTPEQQRQAKAHQHGGPLAVDYKFAMKEWVNEA